MGAVKRLGGWFEPAEYDRRLAALQARLVDQEVDGLVTFDPESVTYITGFHTPAYLHHFQLAIIPAAGEPALVFRDVEQYHVDLTYAFTDCLAWSDGEKAIGVALGAVRAFLRGAVRIGLEHGVHSSPQLFDRFREELSGTALIDLDGALAEIRAIGSDPEIAYIRRAAAIADIGMAAAAGASRPGTNEREVALAISQAMVRAGSDHTEPGMVASGDRAGHHHVRFSDRVLQSGDMVSIETNPHVRHHYARCVRPIKLGRPSASELDQARQIIDLQDQALAAVAPGVSCAVPDRIYRDGFRQLGLRLSPPLQGFDHYPNQTFYDLGFLLPPGRMTYSAAPGKDWNFMQGMTFHSYFLAGLFPFSETILITATGHERLTRFPRELVLS